MRENQENGGFFSQIIKGLGLALIISLLSILIFAFIIKTAKLNSGVIRAVNQFIKVVSIFLGCFFFLKNNLGWIKGIFVGLLFTAVIYLIFSLLFGGSLFSSSFFIELTFCAIIGAFSGILSVNAKK